MKIKLLLFVIILLSYNLTFAQTDSLYTKAVIRYMAASRIDKIIKSSVNMVIEKFENEDRISKENLDIIKEEFTNINNEDMLELITDIYKDFFSESELNQLSEFYESPIGQKYIDTLPMVMKQSEVAGKNLAKKILIRVKNKLKK